MKEPAHIMTSMSAVRSTSLRVRPTGAAAQYRQGHADVTTMARDLAVTHVLYVTVRRAGDKYYVTVRLLDTTDGNEVRNDRITVESRDLMHVEEQIADRVVRAFTLGEDDRERARRARHENLTSTVSVLRDDVPTTFGMNR